MANTTTAWYRDRIGDPATTDEATGYWVFALGVLAGFVGIALFLASQPASTLRQWSIVLAAAGLGLLLVGPIIRLPLRQRATYLAYLGFAICVIAIIWFIVAFPANWDPNIGNQPIIALYTLGLAVIVLGGVFIPLLTAPVRTEAADDETAELRVEIAELESERNELLAELDTLRTSQARFELFEDADEEWRWRLRHRNGNVIADSGEGYTRRHNAQNGLESVKRNALGGPVFLIDPAEVTAGAEFDPIPEVESRATFEVYTDDAGESRWRLVHDNGNILADSGEGYVTRQDIRDSVRTVKAALPPAGYLRADPTAFEVYRDEAAEWRWRLIHANGNILADSGEGYARASNARRAVNRIRDTLDDMAFDIYEDAAGDHRWRLVAANDRVMADSGEGYESRAGAEGAVDRVTEYIPAADTLEIGIAAIEVFEDSAGEFRWRLRHRNGAILADSGESYTERTAALDAIETVKRNGPGAPVEES